MSKNEQKKSSQMETDALEFITNLIAIHQEIQLDEIAEELKNNPQERSIVKQYNFLDLISSGRTSAQRLLFLTLTRPIGLSPHTLVAQKIADQR